MVSERPYRGLAKGRWCVQMIGDLIWRMQWMWRNCVENLYAKCFCKPLKNSSFNPGFCQEHFSLGFILKQVLLINCITGALYWQPVHKLKCLNITRKIINQMQYNNTIEQSSTKSMGEGGCALGKQWDPRKKFGLGVTLTEKILGRVQQENP